MTKPVNTIESLSFNAGQDAKTRDQRIADLAKLIKAANDTSVSFKTVATEFIKGYGLTAKVSRKSNGLPGNLTPNGGTQNQNTACRNALGRFISDLRAAVNGGSKTTKAEVELCEVPADVLKAHKAFEAARDALAALIAEYDKDSQKSIKASLAALEA